MRDAAEKSHSKASLTEQAYEALKWQILSLEIEPGSYLNELDLCVRLGFGRAPVHHALQRLMHDQLIEILPRKGAIVRSWSPRDVNELVEARTPIEVTVVKLAADRAEAAAAKRLKRRLADGPALIAARDREGLIRLDHEFHLGLAELSGNRVLIDIVGRLHQQSTILWFLQISNDATYRLVQKQHEKILGAVMARDGAGAQKAMREHLESFQLKS